MNFKRTDDVQHHLITSHDVLLVHEHFRFLGMEEFQSWKLNMEKNTTSVFVKIRCHSSDDTNIWWYMCHRSGCYQPRVENRHRRIKLQGSMKIGGYCPAAITLFENKETGRCKASYVSTHLGHNTCDETELAHMYPTIEEKEQLAEKIVEGVPYNRILTDNVDVAEEDPSMDPLYLLNKQSLFNISNTFRIEVPAAPAVLKPYSVEAFVAEYHASILFLKRAGEKHPTLDVDDEVVIVMTPAQEELFRKFGNLVVTADGTFGVNQQDLVLHALSIVDSWYEATPVALAISGRCDQIFTDLFVRTVRQRVGKIAPITFMSEMGTTYYESWRCIMGPVQFQLFCRWHVENSWRQSARKITEPEKRNEILRCLLSLSMCLDENQFLLNWKMLLADEDPKVQSFIEYLKTSFADNVESWAYCYRANAGLNNNFHLKAFDRCLKYFNGNLLKEATFTEFLSLLNDFLELETKDLTRKRIFGKLSSKLANLRKRHDIVAKKEVTLAVDLVDDPFVGWLVSVCEGDEDSWSMYAVRPKREECDGCKMVCEGCASCLHLYECTCRDYCIEFNMCIHIHKVCLHLKESLQPSLDDESCKLPNNHSLLQQWDQESNDSQTNRIESAMVNVTPHACDNPMKQEVQFDDKDEYEFELFEESLEAPNLVDASLIPGIELCKQIKTVEGVKVVRQIVKITEAELNPIDVGQLD